MLSVGELFWLRGVYPPTEQTGRGCSPTDFTDSHRWLVALVAAWVRQDAIPSNICVNLCYLWETLLYKKFLCVPWVLWEYSSPTDYTDQHRWLVALILPRNSQNSQKFGCVSGCVGTAGCHTLLNLCKSVPSVGDPSLQEASVGSVRSVGIQFSHGLHWSTQMVGCVSGCVGTAGCHTLLHLCKSVQSVGDPSLQEASVRSVRSVGIQFSHGLHWSTQMVGCVSSPTESTELTEVWLR